MISRRIADVAIVFFIISLAGILISLYETSDRNFYEYTLHCDGPGTIDRRGCMMVYYRNKSFYQVILRASVPILLMSGLTFLAVTITKRNKPKYTSKTQI
ncbi:MAG: hypothetical protein UX31_C0003G0040 [Candidatus Nomurabacteria bacterium GW2011_GWA1_46_11]|uniref:Uncharacterized protein n=1 Tax=Candidatus Nomurabacteria bacterium GW2011_GWA1_46_11 TaxID=1618732 RepID=A0A0G1NNY8_9BACT|nr:MAG: hypothetical protein UW69_C0026G0017 [Microgenomates group bacterium GW2011_GWA2_44_7]KKT78316.1 MAG: hypothetical protein UW73_C0004G0040 [Microgenomates group bacterium GW2011_GWB1_44_8]KKU22374.1 MAG: hypothetical protein UX31_C0003G0040 [Candidatus Nomurabacteria bacterium GW2011_GWA1_46_11]